MGQKIIKRWFWRRKTTRGMPGQDPEDKWKDIASRAAKTFLQAFIASIPVDAALLGSGWNVWRATLLSAAAAGISAAMNFIIAVLKEDNDDKDVPSR